MDLLNPRGAIITTSVICLASFFLGYIMAKKSKKEASIEKDKNDESENSNTRRNPDSWNADAAIKDNYSGMHGDFKMVLCVNTQLKMGKGKIAAQCGHATLGAYKIAQKYCSTGLKCWEWGGQAKICVKVPSEEELLETETKAKAAGLVTCLVRDAGHTQIAAGSRTVLALGPAPVSSFEGISDHFKLM
mmetsp:Transcript_26761/g.34507  ORF Transcript_26761/g.34507 Transcript_26761/m.34507 type:complete len:189 (-) Transcript_26761:168-734(-)